MYDALRSCASDVVRLYGNYKTPCGKNEIVRIRRENLFLEPFARLVERDILRGVLKF